MKHILIPIFLFSLASVQSCQKKASENTTSAGTNAAASDTAISNASNIPNPSADYTPNYKTPPMNRVNDAIAWTTTALNNRDSAGFWNSLTWEDRDRAGFPELFKETQTMWDSTIGCRVEAKVISTSVFAHTVHEAADTALFAHAIIDMRISGSKNIHCDSLTAILRVENGKWLLGSFSMLDPNKPFRTRTESGLR